MSSPICMASQQPTSRTPPAGSTLPTPSPTLWMGRPYTPTTPLSTPGCGDSSTSTSAPPPCPHRSFALTGQRSASSRGYPTTSSPRCFTLVPRTTSSTIIEPTPTPKPAPSSSASYRDGRRQADLLRVDRGPLRTGLGELSVKLPEDGRRFGQRSTYRDFMTAP